MGDAAASEGSVLLVEEHPAAALRLQYYSPRDAKTAPSRERDTPKNPFQKLLPGHET